jgi:heat shock protein HtpX
MKLERAQRRQWEGLVLPGGRIPDPSILRTHPVTEERVARLMALKGGAGEPLPPVSGELVRRATSVPRIRMREPLALSLVGDAAPCRDESLHYPEGAPRIRVRRGGVWW